MQPFFDEYTMYYCNLNVTGTVDRKSTRLIASHIQKSRMPSSA